MIDLANLVVDVVGKGEVELPGVEDPRDGETARYSIDRAKQIYDWQPTIPLRQSLKALIGHSFQR
jgi:nucleoside-diphosphate-sugar epimerase